MRLRAPFGIRLHAALSGHRRPGGEGRLVDGPRWRRAVTVGLACAALLGASSGPLSWADPPPPTPGGVRTSPVDGLSYVYVPAGTFVMGCVEGDTRCQNDEKPAHTVELTRGFWMGRTEVTVEAFSDFVRSTGYRTTAEMDGWSRAFEGRRLEKKEGVMWRAPGFDQTPRDPVVHVSWYDAWSFCAWAGGRLPSEAEWEYVARSGQPPAKYPWGSSPIPVAGDGAPLANVADQTLRSAQPLLRAVSGYKDGYAFTAPVGSFPQNGFGVADMVGNVAEWCADWHEDGYYASSPAQDPTGPATGLRRVMRGGAWVDTPPNLRASYRVRDQPTYHDSLVGFRCVLE